MCGHGGLVKKNHGYLLTSLAEKNQISRTYVMEYVKEHAMEKVARGFISLMMFGRMNYLSFRPKILLLFFPVKLPFICMD